MILGQVWLHPKYPWVSLQAYQARFSFIFSFRLREVFHVWKTTNKHKPLSDNSYRVISSEHFNFFWDGKGRGGNCCSRHRHLLWMHVTAKCVVSLLRASFCLEKLPFDMGTQHFTVLAEQPLLKDFFFFKRWLCVTSNSFFNKRPDDQSTNTSKPICFIFFFFSCSNTKSSIFKDEP